MATIPTVDDLRSDPITKRFGDLFNPPGLTNFLGCVQVEVDVTGISSLNFPPFATGSHPTMAFVLDGRHFQSLGVPVTITWQPDHIVRRCSWRDLEIVSKTFLPVGTMGVVTEVDITNQGNTVCETEVGINLQHRVTQTSDWSIWLPNVETDHLIETRDDCIIASTRDYRAVAVATCTPKPDRLGSTTLRHQIRLETGQTWRVVYTQVLGPEVDAAKEMARKISATADSKFQQSTQEWNDELAAIFAPGNDRYDGHLPTLVTTDASLRRIYWMGALGVAYFKRDSPYSVVGRSYDTLMPRYWQTLTCIWDYFLSSPVHALLDPKVMRRLLESWMRMDIHRRFGTVYLTGEGIGPWYAINDYAMVSMAHRYVLWTGDLDWLTHEVDGELVIDRLHGYALHWETRRQESGLAGYGDEFNLLECVGSYVNEVVSLNAANVFAMRAVADLLGRLGRIQDRDVLVEKASDLMTAIQDLYVEGKGFWRSRHLDGTEPEVRHAMDLLTVLNTVADDLSSRQIQEMVDFFDQELMTDTWMRALSASDDDVLFSVRPDHQWTGAYPAWPPEILKGLCKVGYSELASRWARGLALSANQGPFGQAHFADGVVAQVSGGAAKAPASFPYINDWHSSSSGSWVSAVIEGFFGVSVENDTLVASPGLKWLDPEARLENLEFRGALYMIDGNGVHRQEQ